jgi:hypothetical protein
VRPAEAAEADDGQQANEARAFPGFLNWAVSFHVHSMLDAVMLVLQREQQQQSRNWTRISPTRV